MSKFENAQIYIATKSASLMFPNNEQQIQNAYSKLCQTSTMECLMKTVNST